jgi:hypothetical protein
VLLKEMTRNFKIRRAREVCRQVAVSEANNATSWQQPILGFRKVKKRELKYLMKHLV